MGDYRECMVSILSKTSLKWVKIEILQKSDLGLEDLGFLENVDEMRVDN